MDRTARPSAFLAATILTAAVVATQFVSVGREVIDPDESTFILMGADVARGHLPFVEQFDLKPPMIFLLIGSVLALFGKSIVAVRLLGDLLLLGTAILAYRFSRPLAGGWPALGGALLYVSFASFDLGQPTYSELPALFFGMGALLLLGSAAVTRRRAALAGLAIALAVLSRSNLYQLPVVFGLLLLIADLRRSDRVQSRAWLFFGLGGLIPVVLLVAAYAANGQLAVLKLAMIDVPLAYAQQVGPVEAVIDNLRQFYVMTTITPLVVIPFVLLTVLGLVLALVRLVYPADAAERWQLTVLLLAAAAILVSLVFSGAVYPHYWLQLLPVLAVFCAVALAFVARLPLGRWIALALALMPVGAAVAERLPQSLAVASSPALRGEPFDVEAAARHIAASGVRNPSVWSWRKQLIGWYLDAPQLSKAGVQPENIARPPIVGPLADHGYVGKDEVGRIMAMVPDFVVTDAKGKGHEWIAAARPDIDAWLKANYRLDARYGDVVVYRKITPL